MNRAYKMGGVGGRYVVPGPGRTYEFAHTQVLLSANSTQLEMIHLVILAKSW